MFSNSSGALWALVQRAVRNAGFVVDPLGIHLLDKGQRSVKGLASGFENVVTMDMILTMSKVSSADQPPLHQPSRAEIDVAVAEALADGQAKNPTHVYLTVLRYGLTQGWSLASLAYNLVTDAVHREGFTVDVVTGRFVRT